MGYRASIEKSILDGKGSVDVLLEKGECSVACQISVTTPIDQEVANVKKCLLAGFQYVAVICADIKKLEQLKKAVMLEIASGEIERVNFLSPEEILPFVQELAERTITVEKTVRGYKVKSNYRSAGGKDQELRKQAIAQVIAGAIKRLKGVKK